MSVRGLRLALCSALFAALVCSGGAVSAAARPVKVGDFTVRLARSLGFTVTTPAEARDLLAGIGVAVAGDPESPLTEAGALGFARGLGLSATGGGDPSAVLTGPAADLLARVASEAILSTPAPPGLKGSIPTVCTLLSQGQCFSCCVALLGGYTAVPQRVISLCNSSCTAIQSQLGTSPSSP